MKNRKISRVLSVLMVIAMVIMLLPTIALADAAATPGIDTQPVGAIYVVGDTAAALSVAASTTDGGDLSYRWYESVDNTADDTDTEVGTDSASYTPSTVAAGTAYYYCVVTNTLGDLTAAAASNVVSVAVKEAGYTISSSTAAPGEDVSVSVSLNNKIVGGFQYGFVSLSYNATYLTLKTVEIGNALSGTGTWNYTGGTAGNDIFYSNTDSSNITVSGEVLVLTFTVSDAAPDDTYPVSVSQNAGGTPWFFGSDVTPRVTAGAVTVDSGSLSTYEVAFAGGEGAVGIAPALSGRTDRAEGTTFSVPDNTFTKEDYTFIGWSDGANTYQPGDTYTMPASAVTFTAQWQLTSTIPHAITVASGLTGGSISADLTEAVMGDAVTVTVAPDAGYELLYLTYTGSASGTADIAATGGVYSFEMPAEAVNITALFMQSAMPGGSVTSGQVISTGGTYSITAGSSGTIAINTTDAVTLVGVGVDTAAKYTDLWITCYTAGVNLTIQDLYLFTASYSAGNLIGFRGSGNTLTIAGTDMLEYSAYGSSAMIHVGPTAGLTINGGGTLYLYKYCSGAGIGGNAGEANGPITIAGGTLLIKGSKTGALIGNDTCGDSAKEAQIGDITITGGDITLIPKAQGAGIGGSRTSKGGNVYLAGGTLTVISDFVAGIGAGGLKGWDSSNNIIPSLWGNLYVSGGSLRAVRTDNSLYFNSHSYVQTVDDSLITPNRYTEPGGEAVYKLAFDTALLSMPTDSFTVKVDGSDFYIGGLHKYYYSESTTSTIANFSLATAENGYLDTNLYFYVTGENHVLTVNGEEFVYGWNSTDSAFELCDGSSSKPYIINTASDLEALATAVNAGDSQSGVYYKLGGDIDLSTVCGATGFDGSGNYDGTSAYEKSWTPIGKAVTVALTLTSQDDLSAAIAAHKVVYDNSGNSYTGSEKDAGYVLGNTYYYMDPNSMFEGVLNGQGYEISGLYVKTGTGYAGLFGIVGGTVENLALRGAVTSTAANADYVGGVTGMLAEGGIISGVTVNVTVTASSCYNVGGIAGFVGTPLSASSASDTVVTKCANYGSVTGYSKVGGIAGENAGTISLCWNSGTIDGVNSKVGAGGIAGRNGNNNTALESGTIINCYNTGAVGNSSIKWVGGITGFNNALSTVRNCYDIGAVQGYGQYNPIVGQNEGTDAMGAGVYNSYYREDLKTYDDNGVYNSSTPVGAAYTDTLTGKKTTDEMKSADLVKALGSAFRADAATPLNDGYPVLSWQGGRQVYTVTLPADTGYTVTPVSGYSTNVISGADFKFTVAMDAGYTLNYVSVGSNLTPVDGVYTISNITSNKTVTLNFTVAVPAEEGTTGGNPNAGVWDGETIDIRWFTDDPNADSFYIGTPAELAGLAALVNGIYNDGIKYIYGDAGYLIDNQDIGTTETYNNATPNFHYGSYDFDGKTIYLTADIDMGSSNYMPVGGQYLMEPGDPAIPGDDNIDTRIDASFNGTFDGGGHTVTLYCSRWAESYGNGQSIGLIGRLGCHDDDVANGINALADTPTVRNVAVKGYVKGNRSVGGIVGKTGKSIDGTLIENCANFAVITGTDSKGTGGICGAAWNGGTIKNCYNAGAVTNMYKNAGGISGSCEAEVINCYNVGVVTSSANNDMAIATNNGGATFENCWYLDTSTSTGGIYSGGSIDTSGALTSEEMKSADFLNAMGSAFASDIRGINGGYPVLLWQASAGAVTGTGHSSLTDKDTAVTININASMSGTSGVANVTSGAISDAVTEALDAGTGATIGINVKTSSGCTRLQTTIPSGALSAAADSGIAGLIISSDLGSVTLGNSVLSNIASQAGDNDVSVTFAQVETASLSAEQQKTVGNGVVVSLSITAGGGNITSFDGDPVSFSLPVTAAVADGQTVNVYYLNSNNQLVLMEGTYDGSTGMVTFTTTHLSNYVLRVDKAWVNHFADVTGGSWYYDSVKYAFETNLFSGMSDTAFGPDTAMTRAMLVTVLWRLDGSPAAESAGFADVADGTWYTDAVSWAAANGIVSGYSDETFGPNDGVTREQMAAILYRYAAFCGYGTGAKADLGKYSDRSGISEWAKTALSWANAEALITGTTGTTLAPSDGATRAQVATILMRFLRSVAI